MNEEKVLEILVNFANAIEAASVDLKHRVGELTGVSEAPAVKEETFTVLKWETKQGNKGDYQQTTKEANNNSEVFRALQKILTDHGGFWQSSSHRYWFHSRNADIIDRRKK